MGPVSSLYAQLLQQQGQDGPPHQDDEPDGTYDPQGVAGQYLLRRLMGMFDPGGPIDLTKPVERPLSRLFGGSQ